MGQMFTATRTCHMGARCLLYVRACQGCFSADTAVDYPPFKTIGNLLGFFHARTRSPLSLLNFNKFKEYYSRLRTVDKVFVPPLGVTGVPRRPTDDRGTQPRDTAICRQLSTEFASARGCDQFNHNLYWVLVWSRLVTGCPRCSVYQ